MHNISQKMLLIHIIDFFYWLYPRVVESSVTATVVSITLSHRTTENEALLRGEAATRMSSLNHDNQYFSFWMICLSLQLQVVHVPLKNN